MLDGKRPTNLLVVVNPVCGKRNGPKVYKKKVLPIFCAAGIQTRVVRTTHSGHATALLQRSSLSALDGVVVVGGDGTLMEVLNGILTRTDHDYHHHLPIGVIPCGSTDAFCMSLHGTQDPITAAKHIATGVTRRVDVLRVSDTEGSLLRYSLCMLSYGYFGDVLQRSEKLRWLGTGRYNVAGFMQLCGFGSRAGVLEFRRAPLSTAADSVCYSECVQCQPADVSTAVTGAEVPCPGDARDGTAAVDGTAESDGWCRVSGRFSAVSCVNVACRCRLTPAGLCPGAHLGDGCAHLVVVRRTSRLNFFRYMYRSTRAQNPFDLDFVELHRVREVRFTPSSAAATTELPSSAQSTRTQTTPVVPVPPQLFCAEGATSADDVCIEGADVGASTAASTSCARAPRGGVWNCDGEIIRSSDINIEVLRGLVAVFGRGIDRSQDEDSGTTCSCCSSCGRLPRHRRSATMSQWF